MPRSSLIDLVADVIDNRLSSEGFTRYKKTWFMTNDLGDYALVELQSGPRLPGMELFYVNTDVVPAPWWNWMLTVAPRRRGEQKIPSSADGLLSDGIRAPDGGPAGLGWTVSDAEAAMHIGIMVADLLTAGPTERLRQLLDRAALRAALLERNVTTPAVVTAFVAEEGPGEQLEESLRQFETERPDDQLFPTWARAYAAGRRQTQQR
jgi:hypothetical protein